MAKKNESKVVSLGKKVDSKPPINPNEYGYAKDQVIEVNANFLMKILFGVLNEVQAKETKTTYDVSPKKDKSGQWITPELNEAMENPKINISHLGAQIVRFMEVGMDLHMANIEKGVAKHQTELNMAQTANIEVESVEVKE